MYLKGYKLEPGAILRKANLNRENLEGIDLSGAHLT